MKYTIEIPKPCSEKWEAMTPTEKGMHCSSCQKEVIDFRNFSNSELAKYVSINDNACGRFSISQLNHEITTPRTRHEFPFKLFLGISSLILSVPVYSQKLKSKIENTNDKQVPLQKNLTEDIEIHGVVSDETGPLPGANIIEKKTKKGTQADVDGIFTIRIPNQNFENHVYLSFEFIGLETQIIEVFRDSQDMRVELKGSNILLGEVVMTGGYKAKKRSFFTRFKNLFRRKSTCH